MAELKEPGGPVRIVCSMDLGPMDLPS